MSVRRLDGRVAIVTGAASGIGRAIACRFAAEGASVLIADLREVPREGGGPTREVIGKAGGTCVFRRTDVSRWDEIEDLLTDTVARFGRLDIRVNNAAVSSGQRLTETQESDWDRVMAVNLKGMFFGCKRAVQQMLSQTPRETAGDLVRGRIINISSQHGMTCVPNDLAYGVSKVGVAYNLGDFLRTLALPEAVEHWSLTTLRTKLIKIGGKVVRHGRYITFQLSEVAIPRTLLAEILRLIDSLRPAPLPP